MNRPLKLSLLLALALGSSQAAALELGQIHIRSALGQPLLAEIPVTLANPAEGQNLSAQLASNVVFERANISNRPTMPLLFTVVGNGNHRLIRITSSVPVNDPYLDLLIEVGSTAGHSTHEYTILLDPPGSVAQAPVPRSSSTSGSGRVHQDAGAETSRRAAASAKPAAPSSTPAPTQPQAQAHAEQHSVVTSDGKYGPVERGQSLSGIARLTSPPGVDVNQMMLALKQANPNAFYRDNINALKTGAVLRVPSAQDAQAVAAAEALAKVQQQNGDWRNGATHTPVAVADAGTRSSTSSPTAGGGNEDRLALAPAQNGGAGGKGKAAQHNQEELTSLQQQSEELKSRVKDLEDINSKDQRLLSLKDSQIAELQSKLAEARKTAGLPPQAAAPATLPAPVAAPTPTQAPAPAVAATTHPAAPAANKPAVAVVPTPQPSAASSAKPAAAATAHAAAVPVASTPAVPVQAKPAPVHATPRPAAPAAEAPWYMQTWAWIAGAGAVVVLLLLALLRGRRKSAGAVQNGGRQAGPSLADRFSDDVLSSHGGSDADQDELLDQLAEHPDNVELHLELVSLYYGRRDVDHFEAAAEAMQAHISDPEQEEWQEVLRMGRDLAPEHPLFANARSTPTPPPFRAPARGDEHEALHPFDLDRYAADEEPPASTRSISGEHRYDFNLTHRDDHAGTPARAEPPAPRDEPVSRWRFDEPAGEHEAEHAAEPEAHEHYSDDPSDTKLDLARAYMGMGDPDGARAMLEEVLQEGSQMQRDMARRLLDELH